jgi:hypothetical protein
MRFFCDEMLARLGRWLRAAGYDTRIAADGIDDRTIFDQSRDEGRQLITCDAKMSEYRHADAVVILMHGNDLENQVRELSERLAIDWQRAPFSRCLVCNSLLEQGEACHWQKVPAFSREQIESVWHCPGCGRIYWAGSHVRRMSDRLARWQGLYPSDT